MARRHMLRALRCILTFVYLWQRLQNLLKLGFLLLVLTRSKRLGHPRALARPPTRIKKTKTIMRSWKRKKKKSCH
ncbi:hypothetical protein BJV78DRAFT_1203745, partial [Lactifluus subvellereus]